MPKRAVRTRILHVLALFVALTLATLAPASGRATSDTIRGQSDRTGEVSAASRSTGVLSIHDMLRARVFRTLRAILELRQESASSPSCSMFTISDDPDPTSNPGPGTNPFDPPEDDEDDSDGSGGTPGSGDTVPFGGRTGLADGTPVLGG